MRGYRDEDKEPVSLGQGLVQAVSERAIKLEIEGYETDWYPRSQIVGDTDDWKIGMTVEVTITAWLAEERGVG